jgi:hypothetical protein
VYTSVAVIFTYCQPVFIIEPNRQEYKQIHNAAYDEGIGNGILIDRPVCCVAASGQGIAKTMHSFIEV